MSALHVSEWIGEFRSAQPQAKDVLVGRSASLIMEEIAEFLLTPVLSRGVLRFGMGISSSLRVLIQLLGLEALG